MVRTLNSPLAVQARLLVVEVLVYGMCHSSLVTGCECPAMHAEGEAMRGWLDCIGLNAAETELLIEEGWAVGDFADMSIEDAVSVLRLRRRVHAWRITRCGYDGWADGGKEGYRDARKAAFELASDGPWQGKSLSLFVRMSPSPESLGPFTHFLQPSLLLFWPWRQAELVVMLEANCSKLPPGACAGAGAAGEHDERTAGNQNWESHQELASSKSLQNMSAEHLDIVRARELLTQNPPHARVRHPVNEDESSIFAAPRSRQQYAYFFADLYTSSEFVGLVDTDTLFITPVTPRSLFDEQERPYLVGFVGSPADEYYWSHAPNLTQNFLHRPHVLRAMSQFPLMVRARHLRALRAYAEGVHGASFAHVFRDLCALVPRCSAFCVIGNYLWHFHRDEYAWRFQQLNPHWQPVPLAGQTDDYRFLTHASTHPIARVAVHVGPRGQYHFNVGEVSQAWEPGPHQPKWMDARHPPMSSAHAILCARKQMLWGYCTAVWAVQTERRETHSDTVTDTDTHSRRKEVNQQLDHVSQDCESVFIEQLRPHPYVAGVCVCVCMCMCLYVYVYVCVCVCVCLLMQHPQPYSTSQVCSQTWGWF